MRWSKLRALIESRFAPDIAKRIAIHSTAYGNCTCGHAWITLDQEVIANFCTRAYFNNNHSAPIPKKTLNKYKTYFVEYGEKSRQDIYQSCFDFVHSIALPDALQSDDVIIQALAVLDKRIHKKKLLQLQQEDQHPLVQKLIEVRLDAS